MKNINSHYGFKLPPGVHDLNTTFSTIITYRQIYNSLSYSHFKNVRSYFVLKNEFTRMYLTFGYFVPSLVESSLPFWFLNISQKMLHVYRQAGSG